MKPVRVRIIECAVESGKKGPEAWVKVQIVADGDEFTLPIAVEDATPIALAWKDPGPMANLTLTLGKSDAIDKGAPIDHRRLRTQVIFIYTHAERWARDFSRPAIPHIGRPAPRSSR